MWSVYKEAFPLAEGHKGPDLKTKSSAQHSSTISCTQLMDDCWKRPDTELPNPSVHPNNRDMPYTYQATND